MRRNAKLRRAVTTQDRILHAAIERFSQKSYGQTGLRDIAADVGVDVAYVHRCFGSKERLFAEAVKASAPLTDLLTLPVADIPAMLATYVLSDRARRGRDIISHSLSSPEALPVIREFIVKEFIVPLTEKVDDAAAIRAALIGALLTGVGIFKNVLRIGPFLKADASELEVLLVHAIRNIMHREQMRDLAPARQPGIAKGRSLGVKRQPSS